MARLGQVQSWNFRINLQAATAVLASTIMCVLTATMIAAAQAQTFTVIHNFTGGLDGGEPYGWGVVWEITP